MTNVTIVDHREDFRATLTTALTAEGFTVDNASDVEQLRPGADCLAIVDLAADEGWAALNRLRSAGGHVPVVGLVDGGSVAAYADGLAAGADNVVSRDAPPHTIVDAVHATLDAQVLLPAAVVRELTGANVAEPAAALSDHDVRLLRLLAEGSLTAVIARTLNVSERTLYREMHRIFAALGATSRSEALVRAAQLGLLRDD